MVIRIEESNGEKAKILFYYNRDTLFEEVALLSNFMAKNLSTKEGASLTDEFAMSDDEKDLFSECVRSCLPDVYESMGKLTQEVVPAFIESKTEDGRTSGKNVSGETVVVPSGAYVEFRLQDNAAYNMNTLTIVDTSINNTLKYGILKEFYSTVLHPDYYKVCTERFLAEQLKLRQRLYQLKKKSIVYTDY